MSLSLVEGGCRLLSPAQPLGPSSPAGCWCFGGGGEGAQPGWKCESAATRADGAAASLRLLEARQRGG